MTAVASAMVLAAGFGVRMRPLTDAVPKPLAPLGGKPLLDRVLDRLSEAGVGTAVVNVHYLAEQIEAHLRLRALAGLGPTTLISDERAEILDTGGGVKKALPLLGAGPFFVHNSDSVWQEHGQSALAAMAAAWDPAAMDGLLLLAPRETSLGYAGRGDFSLLSDGCVMRRSEGESAAFVCAGVSLCGAALLDDTPEGPFSLNLAWDRALVKGRLRGLPLAGRWMHIGTPGALAEAEGWLARPAMPSDV